MKKKCPNCGFLINNFSSYSKKRPHVCEQCEVELYMPGWIDWLAEALIIATLPLILILMLIFSLKVVFLLLAIYVIAVISMDSFFKPKIKKLK